ncbi:DoxX family protein [Plebeiibacterium sediminum]|uniref:DoxX family protein n=1 Tax=Plebeiibacterium sediminum TaxID=2992112 RepID=A0AAE3M3T9_9BACT|nr:DoxX family protein [Plebeiobacterium sediminum]MCW3786629.1 DoxX family protein [Plebeiobacterium sediminum]
MTKNINVGLLVLRVSVGLLMLLHGFAKLVGGIGFIQGMLESKGLPGFIAYGVLVGEVLAPLALIVGFRTRIAAAIFAFNTLVAMLLAHSQQIFSMGEHGGWAVELLGLYLFGAVALIFTGGGNIALSSKNKWD